MLQGYFRVTRPLGGSASLLASIDVYLDQVRRDISERAKQFLTTCALDGLDGHTLKERSDETGQIGAIGLITHPVQQVPARPHLLQREPG